MVPLELARRSSCRAEFPTEKIERDSCGVERELHERYSGVPTSSKECIDGKRHIRQSHGKATCPHDHDEWADVWIRQHRPVLELHGIPRPFIASWDAACISPTTSADGTILFHRDVVKCRGSPLSPNTDRNHIKERRSIDQMWKDSWRPVMVNFHDVRAMRGCYVRAMRGCYYWRERRGCFFARFLLRDRGHKFPTRSFKVPWKVCEGSDVQERLYECSVSGRFA